jgi:hypothetical protein
MVSEVLKIFYLFMSDTPPEKQPISGQLRFIDLNYQSDNESDKAEDFEFYSNDVAVPRARAPSQQTRMYERHTFVSKNRPAKPQNCENRRERQVFL